MLFQILSWILNTFCYDRYLNTGSLETVSKCCPFCILPFLALYSLADLLWLPPLPLALALQRYNTQIFCVRSSWQFWLGSFWEPLVPATFPVSIDLASDPKCTFAWLRRRCAAWSSHWPLFPSCCFRESGTVLHQLGMLTNWFDQLPALVRPASSTE